MALGKWLRGGQGIVMRTLRGTEWSDLLDYLSPSFFEVMPLTALGGQLRTLVGNSRDTEGFRALSADVDSLLSERGMSLDRLETLPDAGVEISSLASGVRRALGEHALTLYFAQLHHRDAALLDLRTARFRHEASGERFAWVPRPIWVRWDPAFLDAVRDLYAGFYLGDETRHQKALARLDLSAAADVFLEHFGGDDQSAVRFRSADFQKSFHEVFVRCREAGVSLHPNFVALGAYLACLYDLLETVDEPLDVRAAFERGFAE